MERITLDYSKKNILIPSKNEYMLQLIAKTEHFIKRMRWKVMEFEGRLEGQQKRHMASQPVIILHLNQAWNNLRMT